MRNPKISIITPTWNAAATIEKTLLSAVNQRYKEIEHIFIDNSSTDQTVSIIRNYQKEFNQIRFISENDNGVYDAMNKGLDLCTGDWIYFLGADDEFYNEHVLEDLVKSGLFQPEQVIYGNVLIKGDAAWAKDGTVYDGPFNLEKLFSKNICHQSIFYPRSVIKEVGYFSDKYQITADWDYNVRCFAKYKFTYTDKIIAIFYGGGKSSVTGVHCFHDDLPKNVIKYFQLDPLDPRYHVNSSPFYYPISRFRIEQYLHLIEDQKIEHSTMLNQLHAQQTQHIEKIEILNAEHKEAILKINAENENSRRISQNKYEQEVGLIQTELNSVKVLLANKEKELNQLIENNKLQVENLSNIISFNREEMNNHRKIYEQEIAGLKVIISEKEQEIQTFLQSYTWKTGKILLSPAQFILSKARKG